MDEAKTAAHREAAAEATGAAGGGTGALADDAHFVEFWRVSSILRGHREDVYDLAWSPCSTMLLSGSMDATAILWEPQVSDRPLA